MWRVPVKVGFLICDPTAEKPDLLKDQYWDDTIPNEMLYTVGSIGERDVEFQGSAEITLKFVFIFNRILNHKKILSFYCLPFLIDFSFIISGYFN